MKDKIVVIGGANIEYILKSKEPIIKGSKNFVEVEELLGGSGMNYALRLLAFGEKVLPILFVGDDSTGRKIYDEICHFSDDEFLDESEFFVPSLTTIRSTILVEGIQRTILAQDPNNKNIFKNFVKKRLDHIESVGAVVIGHIHNDRREINADLSTLSTNYILKHFKNSKDTLIYANLGASQLEYGFDFWIESLKCLDILQLNINELTKFIKNGDKLSLYELIQKLQELDISAIITLDQFGAIGILRGEDESIFMARAISDLGDFVDATGAGDAFCSGMISALKGKKNFSSLEFKEAMEVGRSWASWACKSYGGANNPPREDEISDFHNKSIINNEVVIYKDESMKDILSLIDSTLKRG